MTELEKPVRRRTTGRYDHRYGKVIVSLLPGDVIGFRFERTRTTFTAPVNRLMRQAMTWHADAARAEKKRARKIKRGLL